MCVHSADKPITQFTSRVLRGTLRGCSHSGFNGGEMIVLWIETFAVGFTNRSEESSDLRQQAALIAPGGPIPPLFIKVHQRCRGLDRSSSDGQLPRGTRPFDPCSQAFVHLRGDSLGGNATELDALTHPHTGNRAHHPYKQSRHEPHPRKILDYPTGLLPSMQATSLSESTCDIYHQAGLR